VLSTTASWTQGLDRPSRLLGEGGPDDSDCKLHEGDGDFVLAIDMPSCETEDTTVALGETIPVEGCAVRAGPVARDTPQPRRGSPGPLRSEWQPFFDRLTTCRANA